MRLDIHAGVVLAARPALRSWVMLGTGRTRVSEEGRPQWPLQLFPLTLNSWPCAA
jgi:hypothetical protein